MYQPSILVVEDDADLREALCETLTIGGYSVISTESGQQAIKLAENKSIRIVVSDVQMSPVNGNALLKEVKKLRPELPVLLITAYGTVQKAVDAMRNGAADYLLKPFEPEVLLEVVEKYIQNDLDCDGEGGTDFIAEDEKSRDLADLARRVADSDVTVMITGESGVGKEVVAKFIHQQSKRVDGPFIAINCAAIPDNMLEAILFGYEKGAFTGAYQASPGKFELAQGGTLLLDEISEMELGLQAKLLRVLQEREVERVGGKNTLVLDVRVLATTNRDLKKEVVEGRFREDLYYRLNVFPIRIMPLRERKGDILPIVRKLLASYVVTSSREIPSLTKDAENMLFSHKWPGNVRELDNVIQRALILSAGGCIDSSAIQLESSFDSCEEIIQPHSSNQNNNENIRESLNDDLKSREEKLILETLKHENGSRTLTAEKLGISPRTLRYKLAKMKESGVLVPGNMGAEVAG